VVWSVVAGFDYPRVGRERRPPEHNQPTRIPQPLFAVCGTVRRKKPFDRLGKKQEDQVEHPENHGPQGNAIQYAAARCIPHGREQPCQRPEYDRCHW